MAMLKALKKYMFEVFASMFLLLFVFWSIGYFFNAFSIWGAKFDLASCWGGFAALSGSGVMMVLKYLSDTFGNSPIGKKMDEEVK